MPIKRRKAKIALCVFSAIAILIADQSSKLLISSRLLAGQSIPIIYNILHITFVRNTGAAFGLFKNSTVLFISISVIAIWVILSILYRSMRKGEFFYNFMQNFSLVLIMSGAIGNLIDRIRLGYVIDFIDVRIWPVFNVADSSITIGTSILVFYFVSKRHPAKPHSTG